jgi:Domain of unknown function (DUF4249)
MKKSTTPLLASILLTLSLITWSCGKDFFNSYVEIDITESNPKLVVVAYWLAGSDSLSVFVSKSKNLRDDTEYLLKDTARDINGMDSLFGIYDTVANARVEVYKNDQFLTTIPYFKRGHHFGKGLFRLDSTSGVRYKIKVTAPNFQPVEAEQVVQNKPNVVTTFYIKDGAVYQDPNNPINFPKKGDDFSFEIADDANDENYYTIKGLPYVNVKLVRRGVVIGNSIFTARSIDPFSEYSFLEDKTFKGTKYRWRFYAYNSFEKSNQSYFLPLSNDTIIYTLQTFNKDMYLFNKSQSIFYEAKRNPFFSEPVILHTNIKGGYGLFAIHSDRQIIGVVK